MDLYDINTLIKLKVFTKKEAVQYFGKSYTPVFLNNCERKNLIKHIRKNLYATVSLESEQTIANRFEIGCKISPSAIISHHSALEYYGYYNQVYNEVTVISDSKFTPFDFDGISYRQIFGRSDFAVSKIGNLKVTDLERSVVDCIKDFEKICGLEELEQCLATIPSLQGTKIISYLKKYDIEFLYQKTGFLLEKYHLVFPNDPFLEFVHSKIGTTKRYLEKNGKNSILNKKWNLYVSAV